MDVCVVGAGPAGMMAAISAAENGNRVTLIEQNEKPGKKLFLTGKGRCNITNACPVEELFDNVVTNSKFLYGAFYRFDNAATVEFFNSLGLPTKIERGGRVFPQSDHSSDVIKVLIKRLESCHVSMRFNTKAVKIVIDHGPDGKDKISGVFVKENNKESLIHTDKLILATGGKSYPLTGSDGSMFDILASIGVKANKCEPSLVPLSCQSMEITAMQASASCLKSSERCSLLISEYRGPLFYQHLRILRRMITAGELKRLSTLNLHLKLKILMQGYLGILIRTRIRISKILSVSYCHPK